MGLVKGVKAFHSQKMSFLGGSCWFHSIPIIPFVSCDTIDHVSLFLDHSYPLLSVRQGYLLDLTKGVIVNILYTNLTASHFWGLAFQKGGIL